MDWKFLLSIAGGLAAWVWSVYTWRKSQVAQRAQNEFSRKETLYRDLLRSINVSYKGGPGTGIAIVLEQYRLSWLYAPDAVIKSFNAFCESQKIDESAEKQMSLQQQQEIKDRRSVSGAGTLAELVCAIRRDL